MQLAELEPRWIAHNGNPKAILALRCPHCREVWLTCTRACIPSQEQWKAWESVWPDAEDRADIVGCNPQAAWTITQDDDFCTLTATPSLDASSSGHWHGFITNGAIV